MKYTEEQISRILEHADPDTAAVIRARLNLVGALKVLTTELRNSNEVLAGIVHDMSRSTNELVEATAKFQET